MNIGLDLHGVIDKHPFLFKKLSEKWTDQGHNIFIITGMEWLKAYKIVHDAGIVYYGHFSIVDYHKEVGTKMWQDDKGTWWMDEEVWNMSKGIYANLWSIKLHFDDSIKYAEYFHNDCTFIHVSEFNFEETLKLMLDTCITF